MKDKRSFLIREADKADAEDIENVADSVAAEKRYVVPDSSGDWKKQLLR